MGRGVQNKARRAHSIKALSGHHDSDGAWNHGSWEVHTDRNWPRRPHVHNLESHDRPQSISVK